MLTHPQFDPVALAIGPLKIRWYGLSYLAGFALFWFLGMRRLKHAPFADNPAWGRNSVEDILFIGVLCIVIGGRLGFCLFYQPEHYLLHPLDILKINEGGMSFHGGLLGSLAAITWFAWRRRIPWFQVSDFVAPCIPLGLMCGRIGNFINGELWGRFCESDLPWCMAFPQSGSLAPRHPSQIYQALLEGLLLFVLLWFYARRESTPGRVSAAFLVGYGVMRFVVEFFREPDADLGLLALNMSMGQWLCIPMIAAGVVMWLWCGRTRAA